MTVQVLADFLFHLRVTGALPNLSTLRVTYQDAPPEELFDGYPFLDLPQQITHLVLRYSFRPPRSRATAIGRQPATVRHRFKLPGVDERRTGSLPSSVAPPPVQRDSSENAMSTAHGLAPEDSFDLSQIESTRSYKSYPPWSMPFVERITFLGGDEWLLADILEGTPSVTLVEVSPVAGKQSYIKQA